MLVTHIIETIGHTRRNFLELTADCSPDEMNDVPPGYSNNLIWNLAHVISAQQNLIYGLSGLEFRVDPLLVDTYKPGTRPGPFIDQDEINRIRQVAVDSVAALRVDYAAGIFKTYQERQTRFGVLLSDADTAIAYVSTHETLHFGFAKALLRLLRS